MKNGMRRAGKGAGKLIGNALTAYIVGLAYESGRKAGLKGEFVFGLSAEKVSHALGAGLVKAQTYAEKKKKKKNAEKGGAHEVRI